MLRAQFSNRFAVSEVWNQVFPRGTWHGANLAPIGGSITIDDAMLSELVANWDAAGRPPLPIRKTHQHLDPDIKPLERLELERAYGFLTDMRVTAEGLEVKTEWNAAGKAEVDSGSFAFWSPEWQPKHRDRRTGEVKGWWLGGVALCNNPFFDSMPPVAAANEMPPVAAAVVVPTEPTIKEQHMNEEQLKVLRASLGLAADASIDTVLKAAADQAKKVTTLTASNTTEVVTAAVAPLKAQVETLTAELAKRDEALLSRDVDAAVAEAKRGDGKTGRAIPPTLVAHALREAQRGGLKAAVEFLEALPLTVPMSAVGVPGDKDAVITAQSAHEKLLVLADANVKAGITGAAAMETAIRNNPELARVAQALNHPTSQN